MGQQIEELSVVSEMRKDEIKDDQLSSGYHQPFSPNRSHLGKLLFYFGSALHVSPIFLQKENKKKIKKLLYG